MERRESKEGTGGEERKLGKKKGKKKKGADRWVPRGSEGEKKESGERSVAGRGARLGRALAGVCAREEAVQ